MYFQTMGRHPAKNPTTPCLFVETILMDTAVNVDLALDGIKRCACVS